MFPIWLVILFLVVIPLGSCGSCFAFNSNQKEYGYEFLNLPLTIEIVSVILGLIMVKVNFDREFPRKPQK
jgi:hypothetical protein